jgi:predicted Zn-dependent protease
VNTAVPAPLDDATIIRVLQASKAAAAAGRIPESDQMLARVAQQAPNHPAVLNELGVRMLARGAPDQAQALFARATAGDPKHPTLWANLASSFKLLGRRSEEIDAIEKALALEPRHVSALLQKGAYLEGTGDTRNAARTYQNVLACLAPGAEVPSNIKDALAHA